MNTTEVENFPGFRDGIMGPALMDEMRAQAERFGAELVTDDVTAVDLTGEIKVVTDGSGVEHRAKSIILAMGSGYRELGLPDEKRLSGHGVSWCATCDGFFFRDQDIAVVGGGDSAIEEATFLTRFASKVTLVHRRDELRASKIMQERAFADPKIEFAWNSEVAEIHGDDKLTGDHPARHRHRRRAAARRDRHVHRDRPRPALGAAARPGRPRRRRLRAGRRHPSTHTNLAGVFACGDLVDHTYRQAITAAGTGCAAALDAERFTSKHSATPRDAHLVAPRDIRADTCRDTCRPASQRLRGHHRERHRRHRLHLRHRGADVG